MSILKGLPDRPKYQTWYVKIALNHQEYSVDYKKTVTVVSAFNFGLVFCQKAPSTLNYVAWSSEKYFYYTTTN